MPVLLLLSLLVLQAGPLRAQQNRVSPSLPTSSDAQLRAKFRQDFIRGCNTGRTADVSSQVGYCRCLANAYNTRYDGQTLQAITRLASSTANGAALVDLMMRPEKQTCLNSN